MTDPQIALMMLGLFIFVVFLGFPIAFTLMAMGIGFGYYAYYDPSRMWRSYFRLDELATTWDSISLWIEGFFNNRIFDLFINQTYTVMNRSKMRLLKKIMDSQRAWVEQVAYYELMNAPDLGLAYEHYFPGKLKL